MQALLHNDGDTRPRDAAQERRERERYDLLTRIHRRSSAADDEPIPALEVGEQLGLPREETFRTVQFLAHHGYLDYVGAGPRVRPTEQGVLYLLREARRRRSIRDR